MSCSTGRGSAQGRTLTYCVKTILSGKQTQLWDNSRASPLDTVTQCKPVQVLWVHLQCLCMAKC